MERAVSPADQALRKYQDSRLLGLRQTRYSWWTHARELADFILPRRYRWLITPNQMSRGSPINQHILDSTGTLAARNLAAGLMSGKTPPTRQWFTYTIGRLDRTQTNPITLWLNECERIVRSILHESNFYQAMAIWYFDLVVFGTAVMLIYEDYDNVIRCVNPCFGEYYVDIDGKYRPTIFYREFTLTIAQVVDEFGIENVSDNIRGAYEQGGAALTREIVVAHAIEPNTEPEKFGIPQHFAYRETYWEYGGTYSNQQNGAFSRGYLRKRGYTSRVAIITRWDLVGNDAYGRSPGMDALPDIKQLQQETRRKGQAIDKDVNPPMVADVQLKNQPASLLPGGTTYISGMMATGNDGFKSVYGNWKPNIPAITEDLQEVRARINETFFVPLFKTASQFETRSNVTTLEWDMRRSESLVMLGPVFERIDHEGLTVIHDRVWDIASRATAGGAPILPPPPPEIAGMNMEIEFTSMLATAQNAAKATSIERVLAMAGNLAGIDPAVVDNIDFDMALDIYSSLLSNDPRMIRSPDQLAAIREQRQQQQAAQQQAEMAEKLAAGAKTLSETQVGGGQNALQMMTGGGGL